MKHKIKRIEFGRISHLLLGNFKAFRRTQRIPIRPITLIYGRNNSGKSSIVQALLYAEHARGTGELNPASILKDGKPVTNGGWARLLHGRDSGRPVMFGWEWASSSSIVGLKSGKILHKILDNEVALETDLNGEEFFNVSDPLDAFLLPQPNVKHPDFRMALAAIQKWLAHELNDRPISKDNIEMRRIIPEIIEALTAGDFADEIKAHLLDDSWGLRFDPTHLPPKFLFCPQFEEELFGFTPGGAASGCSLVRLALGIDNITAFFDERPAQVNAISRGLEDDLESHVRAFIQERGTYLLFRWFEDVWVHFTAPLRELIGTPRYLGAVRNTPERIVMRNPRNLLRKDSRNLAPQSSTWISQKGAVQQANDWLRKHRQLTDNIQLRYSNGIPSVEDLDRGVNLNFGEVGFGLSQFLPVLLACFEKQDFFGSGPSGTLLVEEPEAHVHPALQSEIGDLFLEAINRKEHPLAHVICETHSEHLLLRLQRRVREGKLSPSQIAVLYVENLGKESVVREMPLNERGELTHDWPGGFFQEGLREVLM